MKKLYATRRRKATLVVVVLALIITAVALAAWISGSGSGPTAAKGGSPQNVTLAVGKGQPTNLVNTCTPNVDCDLSIGINNPTAVTLTLDSATISNPPTVDGDPSCVINGHVGLNAIPPLSIPPGTTSYIVPNFLPADAGLPICAANASWTIPISISASG